MRNLRRLLALTLTVTTLGVSVMGCGSKEDQKKASNDTATQQAEVTGDATAGGEISACLGPEPNSIDPSLNVTVDGGSYILHFFEGLTKLNDDGEYVVAQAESYTVSEDGLTYTFTLRDDAKWSDGEPVKAGDFVYSWRRLVDPNTASDYNYMLSMVENAEDIMAGTKDPSELGITAVDDKTVEIKLTVPCTYFLEICAFPNCSPLRQDIIEANGDSWTQSPETYIGNGPYVLSSWEHQSKIVAVKNENYYDVDTLGPDTINFVLMEDQNSMLSAYKNGDILFSDDLPSEEVESMKNNGLQIESQLGTYFLCINNEVEELKDANVRKALSLVIDRQYLIDSVLHNNATAADTFVPDSIADADGKTAFHDNAEKWYDLTTYDANVEEAKKLLEEAGYADGSSFPSIEIMINPGHEAVAQAVQSMWKEKLGIESTIVSNDWNVFVDTRKAGDYEVSRHGWLGDYNDPITFLDMWVTGGGNNDARFSNAEYDKLIEEIKASTDQEERFEKMHQAESILAEEQPIIPLYYYSDLYLQSSSLQDVIVAKLGYKLFMHATTVK